MRGRRDSAGGTGDCFGAAVSPGSSARGAPAVPSRRPQLHERAPGRHRPVSSGWSLHDPGINARSVAWSPDGSTLAWTSEAPGWYEVFTLRIDGSDESGESGGDTLRQLTHDGADFGELRFTADGASIVGVRSRHGVADLVRIDAISGEVAVIAAGGTWSSPTQLADGSIVAVHESFTRASQLCRVMPDGRGARARRSVTGIGALGTARRARARHLPFARRDGGARLAVPAALGDARATRARPSCSRTAGRPRSPATSGTASPSTSSTRATPGSRSTSAAAPPTAASSSARTTACGAWPTPTTASPLHDHLASLGLGRRDAHRRSSARATARTWRCTRWSTIPSTASPRGRRSTATATSSPRGRRATSSVGSISNG